MTVKMSCLEKIHPSFIMFLFFLAAFLRQYKVQTVDGRNPAPLDK